MEAKKVVIFGAGPTGARVFEKYKNMLNIIAVSDNNSAKWGCAWKGIEIVPPREAQALSPDIFIIASVQGRASIQSQLRKMGIDDAKIFFDSGFQEDSRFVLYKQYQKMLQDVSGSLAELGVFRGDTAAIMNEAFPERCLYLFDTYEGFDPTDIAREREKNFSNACSGDFSDTTVELVLERMPHPEKCIPKKGWFPESAADIADQFALARLDVDLYEPTKAGLQWFGERLSPGGCLIVDDYFNESYAGVKAAVDEYRKSHSEKKILPFGIGFSVVLI